MQYLILIIVFASAGFMLGFGDNGRGTWSRNISVVAGLVWLAGVVYGFMSFGVWTGLTLLLTSFLVAAIFMNVGKFTILRMRNEAYGTSNDRTPFDTAVRVSDTSEEYDYISTQLEGYEYTSLGVQTLESDGRVYDVHLIQDDATGDQYEYYFDATEAMKNAESNLDKKLSERRAKDKAAVVKWLTGIKQKNVEDIWQESYSRTTDAYDLLEKEGTITEESLRKKLGVSKIVASAIMFRFRFRGWIE